MKKLIQPRTPRLQLRQWSSGDKAPFAALNGDAEVMKYFPKTLSRAESDAMVDKIESSIDERGWGFWAVEILDSSEFIGFVGLNIPSPSLPCSPCVEIGWRLDKPFWGNGFALEAARTSLQVGFEQLELREIVAFTTVGNFRSRAVMERLAMVQDEQTFEHPNVPEESGLREHCLYRISQERCRAF